MLSKFSFTFFLALISSAGSTQEIIGAAMADEKGITQNERKAKYLIVLKKYDDTTFERLDYTFAAPIKTKITYRDSLWTTLNGTYAEFGKRGYISSEGKYINNKKEGSWYEYDDTAHAVFEYKYHLDSLKSVINLDSLSNEKKKIIEDTTGQVEAVYKGGDENFTKIIQTNLKVPERTMSLSKGGTARVRFIIDTTGNPIDIKIIKSVEFALDEEFMRVIALGTNWIPASEKGKKLKAYREQPIKIKIE